MTIALFRVRSRLEFAEPAAQAPVDPLVEGLRRWDPAAVATVYDRHHAQIGAFARRFVGDEAAAEDLVHEVFVTLPSVIQRFDGTSSLATFLLSIAINHARHHVRAAARRRAAMARLELERPVTPDDPERASERRQTAETLSRVMDSLPIEQRAAFVLCEVEERSSVEAASILGVPEATVRTRLFHARRKLRDMIDSEGLR